MKKYWGLNSIKIYKNSCFQFIFFLSSICRAIAGVATAGSSSACHVASSPPGGSAPLFIYLSPSDKAYFALDCLTRLGPTQQTGWLSEWLTESASDSRLHLPTARICIRNCAFIILSPPSPLPRTHMSNQLGAARSKVNLEHNCG